MSETLKNIRVYKEIFLEALRDKNILWRFMSFILVIIAGIIANICLPILFKKIVDYLYAHSFSYIWVILISYAFLWIFNEASMQLRELTRSKVELRMIANVTTRAVENLLKLPFSEFHKSKLGEIISILQRAQSALPVLSVGIFSLFIPIVAQLCIVSYYLLDYYPPIYISIMFLTLFSFMAYIVTFREKLEKITLRTVESDKSYNSKIVDYLKCYESIKVFGAEQYVTSECRHMSKERERLLHRNRNASAVIRLGQMLILGLGVFVLTFFTVHGVMVGELTGGDFVLFNGYLMQFITPVSILGYNLNEIKKSVVEMRDVIKVLSYPGSAAGDFSYEEKKMRPKTLEFQQVSFHYNHRHVLKDVTFTVKPKEKIIIVGVSGAGKSTIARLMLNLYTPQSGKILLGEKEIQEISSPYLRNIIGYMPQETQLIHGSLEDNLRFTNPEATEEEMNQAIDMAELRHIKLQQDNSLKGMPSGQQGIQLSTGEKQRLGIARIFLKDPSILILDEPFSSLDIENSLKIYNKIMEKFANKTIITITHRLLDVMHTQKIIYLDKGKILKIGSYEQLIASEKFRKLFGLASKKVSLLDIKKASVQ